jgi:hypothetical protein
LVLWSVCVAGCATAQNTPAQDLAWERWRECSHFSNITLKEIRANGQVWAYTGDGSYNLGAWRECMQEALVKQRAAGQISSTAGPELSATSLKELIRFAYLTNEPPPPGTFLRSTGFSNMPPNKTEFAARSTVTFFYAISQVGRAFDGQILWLGPNGEAARKTNRLLDQTAAGGTYSWWTDSLPATATEPGSWIVELWLNGSLAGRYPFTVWPPR